MSPANVVLIAIVIGENHAKRPVQECNSATVYSQLGGVFFHSNAIHVRTSGLNRAVQFVSFVCASCGYFENFIADTNKLAEVARTWPKVNSPI